MYYYQLDQQLICSFVPNLPLPTCDQPQQIPNTACFLFSRPQLSCRASFAVSDYGQLRQEQESWQWLDTASLHCGEKPEPLIAELIVRRALKAVNYAHPRWRELLSPAPQNKKRRLHLLALGDVGGSLLTALRLLGGEQLSAIGIHDIDPRQMQRWEMEMNQIQWPDDYQRLPRVEIIDSEQLFDCDMFVFCASCGIPALDCHTNDIRMAQLKLNAPLIASYARQARAAAFRGLFCVVSDPVDPLCRAAFLASNQDANGKFDALGLAAEQIKGYGLGVMNARAAYFAARDQRFASFLQQGRAFGPHGADLVLANAIEDYDDTLSCELTGLVVDANLQMRNLGFKPYIAPAVSSGAMSLLLTLSGGWHYSSLMLGPAFIGCRNRLLAAGGEIESLPLPPTLSRRINHAAQTLAALNIEELI